MLYGDDFLCGSLPRRVWLRTGAFLRFLLCFLRSRLPWTYLFQKTCSCFSTLCGVVWFRLFTTPFLHFILFVFWLRLLWFLFFMSFFASWVVAVRLFRLMLSWRQWCSVACIALRERRCAKWWKFSSGGVEVRWWSRLKVVGLVGVNGQNVVLILLCFLLVIFCLALSLELE